MKKNQYSHFTNEDHDRLLRSVQLYRNGEDSAFNDIYNLTRKYLWPTALRNATHTVVCNSQQATTDRELAEDMLEDTMEVVLLKLRTELREPEKYCAWVKTIINNKFKHIYAKRDREFYPSQSGEEEQSWNTVVTSILDGGDEFVNCENRIILTAGMKQLNPGQQCVIFESYFLGYKGQEIAMKNNIPEGTVKTRKKERNGETAENS